MAGGFKRSSRFGLIGVFVAAALAIVIATTMGQGDPNPKLALGLIFGVIAIFGVILLVLQRSDLERAAGSGAAATNRAAAEDGRKFENPTTAGFDYRQRGWTLMSGERRGVMVRLGGHEDAGTSEVIVAAPSPEWSAHPRDGRVRPAEGPPDGIVAALEAVSSAVRWKRVEVQAGAERIVVTRKNAEQQDWLCDLWLAERLAGS